MFSKEMQVSDAPTLLVKSGDISWGGSFQMFPHIVPCVLMSLDHVTKCPPPHGCFHNNFGVAQVPKRFPCVLHQRSHLMPRGRDFAGANCYGYYMFQARGYINSYQT